MSHAEARAWFADIDTRVGSVRRESADGWYVETDAARWLSEAESALAAVLPPAHPCRTKWKEVFESVDRQRIGVRHHAAFEPCVGIFRTARAILEAGRLDSVFDGIRIDTLADVIEQARALLPQFHIAAAVLAGGALETHLLHLCQRHGIVPAGEGSIAKYDGAIAQARNAGTVIYSATDTKLIGGWGGMRNNAAHDPTNFQCNAADVRGMVDGILQFFARVP